MPPSEDDDGSHLTGIMIFAVLILLYNLALWGTVRLLNEFGVIGWSLKWHESGLITLILMVWRMVDRAAFKKDK